MSTVTQYSFHSNRPQSSSHPDQDLDRIRLVVKVVLFVLLRLALVRVVLDPEQPEAVQVHSGHPL